jgi:putative heme-binding domain-containing protein
VKPALPSVATTAAVAIAACLFAMTAGGAPAAPPAVPPKPADKNQYLSFAMTHTGDPERGKKLFLNEQRLACARCHSTDGKGGKAGPDLFAIGDKFGRRDLVDAVLSPSATIAVGYSTTVVKTRSGDVFDGVLKEAGDAALKLIGADGKTVSIETADVAERRTTDLSLMPENLYAGLSTQEFADLIEYLASLRLPASAAAVRHGAPAEIPALSKPVELTPFHSADHHFEHPVWFGPVPGISNAFTVVEHETGRVWLLDKRSKGEAKTPFLDTGRFMPGTRGLLGMVFHPRFAENRRYFYAKHLAVEKGHFATFVFEGAAALDGLRDSGKPAVQVLRMDETSNVHYGGGLAFGPDGFLYIGMGDSGPQQDPQGNAQNLSLPLGKMLRIDVDHNDGGKSYAIPSDNPFVGRKGVMPETWAVGLREPWRFSFDPVTGDLWVGDVGQDLYEEVDVVRRGENYGWNVYEGFEPFSNRFRREGELFVAPVFAYSRRYGASVTGGFVYRGDPKSSFYGVYVFGDYQTKRLFALTQENRSLKTVRQIATPPQMPVSFGRDERGELYMVGYEGTVYHIDLSHSKFE